MEVKAKYHSLSTDSTGKTLITFEVEKDYIFTVKGCVASFVGLTTRGKEWLRITFKEWREKRSLDANAYAWLLMDKLAKKLGSTKEEIYLETIRKVGSFEIIPIKSEAVLEWVRKWNAKGLGWVSEEMGESKIKGYINTMNYFGSSVYNTKEMAILIDEIITECKANDIETLPPDELERLKSLWQ